MRFLLLCILTVVCQATVAQQTWQTYTPTNGLVDARVHKIFQDSRGILYFLTRDGFSSFDGQRFVNHTQTGTRQLTIVNGIHEMPDGRMLISALSGIFYLQDQHLLYADTTLFTQVKEPGDILPTGPNSFLLSANNGLFYYDGKSVQRLSNQLSPVPDGMTGIDKMILAGDYLLSAATSGRTGRLLLRNWHTLQPASELKTAGINSLVYTGKTCFVHTTTGWLQLNTAAWQKGGLAAAPLCFRKWIPPGFDFQNLYIDREQRVWLINAQKGLCCIDTLTGSSTMYNTANGLPDGATDFFEDAEWNGWLMTPGKGVHKLSKSSVHPFMQDNTHALKQGITLSGSSNRSVVVGKKDTLLTFRNGKADATKNIAPAGSLQAFEWNGQLWYLLGEGAIESVTGKRIHLHNASTARRIVSFKVAFDRSNRLLIAGEQLSIVDTQYRQWSVPLPYFTDRAVADTSGNYWCFARDGSIVQYRLQTSGITRMNTFLDKRYSTRDVMHWNGDTFCIGTRTTGLVLARAGAAGYQYINAIGTSRGLTNLFVTGMAAAGKQQLLVATVTGLDMVHFYPADTTVEQLYSRISLFNGVISLAPLGDSSFAALNDDGHIYQVVINPTDKPAFLPRAFFNSLWVNGEKISATPHPSFAYNRNNLRFSISAPSFIDEKNIRFSFRLTSNELERKQEGLAADFDMANLPPGRYHLQVTVYFPGNRYAPQSLVYDFVIRKPFWKTAGFITATVLLLFGGIYALFRSILQRKLVQQRIKLEKEKAIAGERTRIATDMHDDLGAGISTIKYLSQSAPFIAPEVQKENNLKIAAQADELVDKMNDIIWAMNESNDSLDNLVYYCKAWVVEYCDMRQLPVKVQVPGAIPGITVRGDIRQHIFLCIKEAVHNVVKHAGATAMELRFAWEPGKLAIVVRDNGQGFDRQKIKLGNGLHNMQKRMQQVKGTLEIATANGTNLYFSVPL